MELQNDLQPRLLRVEDAAALLGLSRSVVYELIGSGRLESVTVGRSRRIPVAALDAFVASRRGGAHA